MEKGSGQCWEEYRNVARVCKNEMRKAKAHLKLDLVREAKVSVLNAKRKIKEKTDLLLNDVSSFVTKDWEGILNAYFASVFTAKTTPQESEILKIRERVWGMTDFTLVEEDLIIDHLGKCDTYKSLGLKAVQQKWWGGWLDCQANISIIFDMLQRTGELPEDWK